MKTRIRIECFAYDIKCVTYGRLPIFRQPSFIIPIVDSLNYYRYQHRCKLVGFVIMLNHIHLILWRQGETKISEFMRDFKRFTSGRISRQAFLEEQNDWVRAFEQAGQDTSRAESKVWQDGFWEEIIFTDEILLQKLDYIHMNPVRAGVVDEPQNYPYSSYRNYELDDDSWVEIDKDWA